MQSFQLYFLQMYGIEYTHPPLRRPQQETACKLYMIKEGLTHQRQETILFQELRLPICTPIQQYCEYRSMNVTFKTAPDSQKFVLLPSRFISSFGDIVGFTAWSSARSPSDVFVLLETIYSAFDDIAKRRGVFKVETIGGK
jgi:Adenylate and Guanylate cyclase catalytic domain